MTAPTLITPQNVLGPFDVIAANAADFVWAAGTITNGDYYVSSGKELLLVENTDSGVQTITVVSEDDAFGRKEDITAYPLGAGEFAIFTCGLTNEKGWMGNLGVAGVGKKIRITVSDAKVKVAVLRLPAGYGR
jgi:hypothetical protein